MVKIVNPHDKLFRGTMHNITVARGFLERHMNELAKAPLDLSTLKLKNTNSIDKGLSESISDLVYSCQYKDKSLGESRVIVLVEHQSKPHKFMPFRVYHYLFNQLANELKQKPNLAKLPAVYALVFYHGEQTPYPYSLKLNDCFNDPYNMMAKFWQNPIELIDVNQIQDSELLTHQVEDLLALALKHGRDEDIGNILLRISIATYNIDFNDDFRLQFIEMVAAYLLSVGKIVDKQQFRREVTKLPNMMRGKIMTFAEEMRAEGKLEGEIKGKEEVAVNLLKLNLSHAIIAQSTGLAIERIVELKNQHGL